VPAVVHDTARVVLPGQPFPHGPRWDGRGTSFSLFSEHATAVELCLFDADDREERVGLHERTAFNWHGYLPGVGPGQRYAYRVHGPWAPEQGHRFNAAKLLIDPYAKAIEGPIRWERGRTLGYADGDDLVRDDSDDAAAIPRCVVVDESFDWEGDGLLNRPWAETVIYELHVRGFTKLLPAVREDLRGTYAGLASEAAIEYLLGLGVTAVELLPIHHIADEHFLVDKGLTNYWGYSTIGYLAPHAGYAATGARGEQVREFKGMVKALHRAGIEVILDVVYNHTAEGNHLGPTLSFRGVDNLSYYRTVPGDPRHYMDFTGTGNSLNPAHPSVLRLIMDSLRYFVLECHVDGFRFDLASALAREFYGTSAKAAIRSATSRCSGRSGTASTETRCATSGASTPPSARSRSASPARATSTTPTGGGRSRRSTSSPVTTGSRSTTWSRTRRSTTRRTWRTTGTGRPTTAAGTAVSRGRPTTRPSTSCASGRCATS
jgi:glycogen operon protein